MIDKIKQIKYGRLSKLERFLTDIFSEIEIEELSDIINYKHKGITIISKNINKKIVEVYFYRIYGNTRDYFSELVLIKMLGIYISSKGYLLSYNLNF